jgi:MRC1-like domain
VAIDDARIEKKVQAVVVGKERHKRRNDAGFDISDDDDDDDNFGMSTSRQAREKKRKVADDKLESLG